MVFYSLPTVNYIGIFVLALVNSFAIVLQLYIVTSLPLEYSAVITAQEQWARGVSTRSDKEYLEPYLVAL